MPKDALQEAEDEWHAAMSARDSAQRRVSRALQRMHEVRKQRGAQTPTCTTCGKPAVGMVCESAFNKLDPRHRVAAGMS